MHLQRHRGAVARGIVGLALGVIVVGCSESSAPDRTSTVQGALSVATFPGPPESVEATNELGTLLQVPVSSTGNFQVDLLRDHSYTLAVSWGGERVRVVFPRASGQLTSRFGVSSGAARVSLGAVRYFAAAPAAGFFLKSAGVLSAQLSSTSEQADGELGECVHGMILGTGAICVDDDGDVACEGDRSDGDGECEGGVDSTTGLACVDPPDASDGDGECEDGVDSTTGLACVDPPEGSDGDGECEGGVDSTTGLACVDSDDVVDRNQPMAVAEHNVPDQVGGCDEGGEEDDDEEEDDD